MDRTSGVAVNVRETQTQTSKPKNGLMVLIRNVIIVAEVDMEALVAMKVANQMEVVDAVELQRRRHVLRIFHASPCPKPY